MLAKRTNGVGKRPLAAAGVWIVVALSAVLLMGQVHADEPAAAAEEAVVQDAVLGQSIQTIAFKKDMPIKDALRMLAQMYQKNIVPSASVDGIVTVTNLYDVTFEEAMQAILGTHKYEVKGNFIKVYTNDEFMADESRFEHAMITLHYINSDEAVQLATPLLSESGSIGATTAADPQMVAGEGGDTLAVHDRLVVKDYPENIERIREVLSEVDAEPMQVLLEVTIMKAKLTEATEFGIDWSNLPGVQLSNRGVDWQAGELTVGVSFDNITGLITALETVTDATILANPKILALNKQAGNLTIGTETGYRDSTTQNQSGSTTQAIEFLKTGTLLTFRPFIGRDGLIRMEIAPEQSSGGLQEDSQGSLPFKDTTSIVTNVMVKDGQTIVLGGLFQEETTLNRNQAPVIGDIPGIGELFKNTDDESIRSELIILLTPHIIETPGQADGMDRLEDALRLSNEVRQNITWLSRARLDEARYADAVELYTNGKPEKALAKLNSLFNIQRSYLDQVRLKERIIRETQPDQVQDIERIMLRTIEKEESDKWFRR
ncbi:MAG: type II secretion system protein GspD [Planctomycetota bacterium]|jgi:type II secretory pathway component GspD/PulD (secretin)